MNLLDRVIDNHLLDLNITSQLADISYRTNNGIRQKTRNFAEGIVDSGRIHFNDAKDKITKDMILEYQQEQQEIKPVYVDPITGDEKLYYPSVYKLDPTLLQVYAPVAHATLGAPVVVKDIDDFYNKQMVPEINNYKAIEDDLKKKKEALDKIIHDAKLSKSRNDELNYILAALNTELTDIKKK